MRYTGVRGTCAQKANHSFLFLFCVGIILGEFAPCSDSHANTFSIRTTVCALELGKLQPCRLSGGRGWVHSHTDGVSGHGPGHPGWSRGWGRNGIGALLTGSELPRHFLQHTGCPLGCGAGCGCSKANSCRWPISLDCGSP